MQCYQYCTSFNKAWAQVLHRFKSCLWRVGDSKCRGSLTRVPAGNKAECLSSVNHNTKAIHHHPFFVCLCFFFFHSFSFFFLKVHFPEEIKAPVFSVSLIAKQHTETFSDCLAKKLNMKSCQCQLLQIPHPVIGEKGFVFHFFAVFRGFFCFLLLLSLLFSSYCCCLVRCLLLLLFC